MNTLERQSKSILKVSGLPEMRSVYFYLDVEKDYVALCLKKWIAHLGKEELIPKLEPDFYLTEAVKFPSKKATVLHAIFPNTNELSFDIYVEHLQKWMSIFPVKVVRNEGGKL